MSAAVLTVLLAAMAALFAACAVPTGPVASSRRGAAPGRGPAGGRPTGASDLDRLARSVAAPPQVVAVARDACLPEAWVQRWPALLAAALAAVTAASLLAGPLGAGSLAAALVTAPRLLGPSVRRRRLRRRDEQLAPWLERVASGLRAGLSLSAALAAATPTAPWPLRLDLEELDRSVRAGGLRAGLARWADRADTSPAVALAANALDLGASAGGEVARAVDRVAATLRDRREAQAEVRALATQARASAVVLALAPLGFCALLAAVEPAVPRILLTTPIGWACLVGGLGLEAAGAAWMSRIVAGAR